MKLNMPFIFPLVKIGLKVPLTCMFGGNIVLDGFENLVHSKICQDVNILKQIGKIGKYPQIIVIRQTNKNYFIFFST